MLMKITKILFSAFLAMFPVLVNAQSSKVAVGIGTDLGLGGSHYKIVTPHVYATYDITDKLHAGVRLEDAITLIKQNGDKDYDNLASLGGQVGYDVCKILSFLNVQPRVMVGHTLGGGHDRGYTYYQGGVYFKKDKGGIRSEIGLGVRYNDYRGNLYKDKAVFYVSYAFVLQ